MAVQMKVWAFKLPVWLPMKGEHSGETSNGKWFGWSLHRRSPKSKWGRLTVRMFIY